MVLNDEKCSLYDFMPSVDEKYDVSNDDCYQWSFISIGGITINILVGNSLSVLKSACLSDKIHIWYIILYYILYTCIYYVIQSHYRNVDE